VAILDRRVLGYLPFFGATTTVTWWAASAPASVAASAAASVDTNGMSQSSSLSSGRDALLDHRSWEQPSADSKGTAL